MLRRLSCCFRRLSYKIDHVISVPTLVKWLYMLPTCHIVFICCAWLLSLAKWNCNHVYLFSMAIWCNHVTMLCSDCKVELKSCLCFQCQSDNELQSCYPASWGISKLNSNWLYPMLPEWNIRQRDSFAPLWSADLGWRVEPINPLLMYKRGDNLLFDACLAQLRLYSNPQLFDQTFWVDCTSEIVGVKYLCRSLFYCLVYFACSCAVFIGLLEDIERNN